MKNYPNIISEISANLKTLRGDIGPTMLGFSSMAQAATKPGALDKKTKELIALAIGVATHCDGCIGFHTEALVKGQERALSGIYTWAEGEQSPTCGRGNL
jgi:AhpD family alkylhydroperoxidase